MSTPQSPAVYNAGVGYPAHQVIDGNLDVVDVYGTGEYGNITCRSINAALSGMQPAGNGQDDSGNIQAFLNLFGIAALGPGVFTVQNFITVGPQQYVLGSGRWATRINFTGSGDCFRFQNTTFGGGGLWGGGLKDFTVDGASHQPGASTAFHIGDGEQIELNVAAQNFNGPGDIHYHFDNQIWWTEKLHGTIWSRNATNHVVFDVSGATTSTNSFGYLDLTCYLQSLAGQNGVIVQNGALPYHGRLVIKGNFTGQPSGTPTPALQITGVVPAGHPAAGFPSQIFGSELAIQVESGSTAVPCQTINFGSASNSIEGCYGVLDFQGTWTASNLNIPSSAGALWYQGPINGDSNLAPNAGFRLPAVSGALILGRSFMSGANGNLFVNSGDFFTVTLSANITVNLVPAGQTTTAAGPQRKTILIRQATGAGPFTVTWPHPGTPSNTAPTVIWAGGTAPVMTATATALDVYELETIDGITWIGRAIQNVS